MHDQTKALCTYVDECQSTVNYEPHVWHNWFAFADTQNSLKGKAFIAEMACTTFTDLGEYYILLYIDSM